ncbi:MAG: pseudaminic acid cytidylyltransferase [Magnetococcales bacterium]|jgi:N-acylneuraminate cytidylyltransferase|nr:pseudaminic acid cytidylyltransferase [Magnetococcales bacterium]|tara:strand:- start:5072 stop:5758 length:687 start_codon:yes stop_codon:yes gene_type:complete
MKIAMIPARGGSKRIPRKNIRPFAGKPAIAHAIDAAKDAGIFDLILVSTDDAEIAKVAEQYGAAVPFMRPAEISDDHATTLDVIKHTLEWAESNGHKTEALCCIYPVNPFLEASDLKKGYETLLQEDAGYCFPVVEFPSPIQRALKIRGDSRLEMFNPELSQTRTQDLQPAFHDVGQFYWGRPEVFLEMVPIFSDQATPIRIPSWRAVDIDTEEDWQRAELIYKALYQ